LCEYMETIDTIVKKEEERVKKEKEKAKNENN
jgi:hypothetical protein